MNTKDTVNNLRLMADTLEELEIDNIMSFAIYNGQIECHLENLKLTNADVIWIGNYTTRYPWKKSYSYNNIEFFSIHTQKDYEKETNNGTS